MSDKTIKISCKGSSYIPLQELVNFQGNLKTLEKVDFEKLKTSILKYGFTFPVMVWGNEILDGHQRTYVVGELIKDGYQIDDLPVVEIFAKDRKEAAEKLLVLNSPYARMTQDGISAFVDSFDLDLGDMPELKLPHHLNLDDLIGVGSGGGEGGEGGSDDKGDDTKNFTLKFTAHQLSLIKAKLLEFSDVPEIALIMALGL